MQIAVNIIFSESKVKTERHCWKGRAPEMVDENPCRKLAIRSLEIPFQCSRFSG